MSIVERESVEEVVAPKEVTVADVLERAADILEEFDWCQGSSGSKAEGYMCAVGAIGEAVVDFGSAAGPFTTKDSPFRQACAILGWPKELDMWPLAVWNDKPGRTKAEVVAVLRSSAQKAREA
jgi:hypothetical protein